MTEPDNPWIMRESVETFEDLWIWQQARVMVNCIYDDFGESPHAGRDFAFLDQIRRAAISVMNNVSEGFARHSDADFARFLDIAKGSAGEFRSMYYVAEDRGYTPADTARVRREKARQLSAGTAGLTSHLRSK
jgi:four helix bundle protein